MAKVKFTTSVLIKPRNSDTHDDASTVIEIAGGLLRGAFGFDLLRVRNISCLMFVYPYLNLQIRNVYFILCRCMCACVKHQVSPNPKQELNVLFSKIPLVLKVSPKRIDLDQPPENTTAPCSQCSTKGFHQCHIGGQMKVPCNRSSNIQMPEKKK